MNSIVVFWKNEFMKIEHIFVVKETREGEERAALTPSMVSSDRK